MTKKRILIVGGVAGEQPQRPIVDEYLRKPK